MVNARSVEEINAPPPMAVKKEVTLKIDSVKKGEPNISEDDFKYMKKSPSKVGGGESLAAMAGASPAGGILTLERIITHLQGKQNKHAQYIVKCLTQHGNNQNFLSYKLEYLIKEIIELMEGNK